MRVYMYQSALLCETCGEATRRELELDAIEHGRPKESAYNPDSDHWPKGPYDNGGGEADSPQHCDSCGVFLENPLTEDGVAYVLEQCARPSQVTEKWREFYRDELQAASERAAVSRYRAIVFAANH